MSENTLKNKDSVQTNDYGLSIRIDSDGFSFLLSDGSKQVLLSQQVDEPIFQLSSDEIIRLFQKTDEIKPTDYDEINLVVASDLYSFVPNKIFRPKDLDLYFRFQFREKREDLILFNRINSWDCVNVFSFPLELNKALTKLFPEVLIDHHLSFFLSEKIETKEDAVHIWVRRKNIDIAVIKEENICLINSFDCNTDEDAAFFALKSFKQFNFDAKETSIFLYQKNKASQLKSLLLEYIHNCEILPQ